MKSDLIVLKNYIENAKYDLADAKSRIDYAVFSGYATAEEAADLLAIAEKRASEPDVTTKSLDLRVSDLELAMLDVLDMVAALVGADIPEEDVVDEGLEETLDETVDGGAEE